MKKEVLLICPAPQRCRVKPGGKPVVSRFFRHTRLSLLAVAAATPPDWEVRIVDEYVSPLDFSSEPACIGLSFMTAGAPRAYEIAQEFRRLGIPVLAGGFHPTFLPEEVLKEISGLSGKLVIFIDDNLVADRSYALKLFSGLRPLS